MGVLSKPREGLTYIDLAEALEEERNLQGILNLKDIQTSLVLYERHDTQDVKSPNKELLLC